MTFEECCHECIGNKELLREFNRLTGKHLGEHRSGVIRTIDEACGYDPDMEAMPLFVAFVYDAVWCRMSRTREGNE